MKSEINLFDFESNQIRVILDENSNPWFVAKDVAELLGYKNPQKAVRDHCKGVNESFTPSAGGIQAIKIIPERDLYRLVMKSKLPSAEKFEEWVVAEVLPTIRKTGGYLSQQKKEEWLTDPRQVARFLTELADEREKRILLEEENYMQTREIQVLTPKAEYYDKTMSSSSYFNSTEVAKSIGFSSAQKFNEELHKLHYIFKNKKGGKWLPYAKYQNLGLFHIMTGSTPVKNNTEHKAYTQLLFTPAGKKYFEDMFHSGEKPKITNYDDERKHHVKQIVIPIVTRKVLPPILERRPQFQGANQKEFILDL